MGVGRFLCVGLPMILTVGAIVTMLIATLSGIASNRLYLFHLEAEDISIDRVNLDNALDNFVPDLPKINDRDEAKSDNITAKDLNLAKSYDVFFWGYCYVELDSDERHCTKSKFDWASESLNSTYIEEFGVSGQRIKLPNEIAGSMRAFVRISKYTQVAVVLALLALAAEFIIGFFSNFSRVVSCITWVLASVAVVLVGTAASLATAQAILVIGAVEATAKWYGARGSVNGGFLAAMWLSFAFALASGLFWLFTICCCKPERKAKAAKNEKAFGAPRGGYAPLGNDHEMRAGVQHQVPSKFGDTHARSNMAYEPYSHRV